MSRHISTLTQEQATTLRRFADGDPRLRDRSDAEAWLEARQLIERAGTVWFCITAAGRAAIRRSAQ